MAYNPKKNSRAVNVKNNERIRERRPAKNLTGPDFRKNDNDDGSGKSRYRQYEYQPEEQSVRKERQRQGIGTARWQEACRRGSSEGIERFTVKALKGSEGFYRKNGFAIDEKHSCLKRL